MLRRVINGLGKRWQQRYFWASRWFGATVPVHNLSYLPDRFSIERLGDTGVGLVDTMCTPEECEALVKKIRAQLERGGGDCFINSVSRSRTYSINGTDSDDPELLPLLYRASVLFGVPYTALTEIMVGCVRSESSANAFPQPTSAVGGRHVVRVYLGDVEAASAAVFSRLNLSVTPRPGRAVYWSVRSAEDAALLELQESADAAGGSRKWFIQLRFGDEATTCDEYGSLHPPQARQGKALSGAEEVPAGVWAPETIDLEATFGQPDKTKGLI